MSVTPETYILFSHPSLPLSGSFYRASGNVKNHTILYFHGGGLIWGDRDDLPAEYIDLFLSAGYHFLTIDYPLAPEMALPEIYNHTVKAVEWFIAHFDTELAIRSNTYSLFGRSAGAYLVLLLAGKSALSKRPEKIINFYGYASIQEPFYLMPSVYYQSFPSIPKSLVDQLIQPAPLVKGKLETRYAIYIYARQKGRWLDIVLPDKTNKSNFSLTDEELALLPPVFTAHSKTDQDVPFNQAVQLNEKISSSEFIPIEKANHDFDKDPKNEKVLAVYKAVIDWLGQ